MTNLLEKISIVIVLVTNWTSVRVDNNELGYVAENHVAQITYAGATNEFVLMSHPNGVAVFRPFPAFNITNLWWPGLTLTNLVSPKTNFWINPTNMVKNAEGESK